MIRAGLALLLLLGCGVAGRPIPPGPVPPAAPTGVRVLSTPSGLEVQADRPTRDIDGGALDQPVELLLFADDPRCAGRPAHVSAAGPLSLKHTASAPITLRVAAAVAGRRGPPAPPVEARWIAPPPPPDPPVAFATPDGGVQVAWLPPPPPATVVRVLRDGAVIGQAPAAQAGLIDRPSRGVHRYAIIAATPNARSAPSPAVSVVAP